MNTKQVPVLLLTGYLGSGKTTSSLTRKALSLLLSLMILEK